MNQVVVAYKSYYTVLVFDIWKMNNNKYIKNRIPGDDNNQIYIEKLDDRLIINCICIKIGCTSATTKNCEHNYE